MEKISKFYIDGAWVAPSTDRVMPVKNPGNNETFAQVPLGDVADVDRAVAAARKAFQSFSQTSKADRLALMRRILEVTKTRYEDLAQAISREMGAPITMARDAQADCAIGHLVSFIDALEAQEEREILLNGDIIRREPIGVCGLITPWNWPMNQIVLKVIPVIASGSTCVLKPSEHTPVSAMVYAEILHEAGVPAGVFNLVNGEGPVVGAALSKHDDVEMISFTGSTRAGAQITKDAADTVKRVTLELGGKSPNLVFADCDLEARIAEGVAKVFYNTGQSCDAPTRMLVERSVYDKAVELAAKFGAAQKLGDPAEEGDHIGPLFDQLQYDRVQSMIQAGIDEGARLICGGLGKPEGLEAGWFVKPTIFADVTADMRVTREEIFGPVLVMMPFDDEEQAIAMGNDTEYGLAAYVQTSDLDRAERVADRLRAGTIRINGVGAGYGSPFGGYKQSGIGREGGVFGLEDFQEIKVRPNIRG